MDAMSYLIFVNVSFLDQAAGFILPHREKGQN